MAFLGLGGSEQDQRLQYMQALMQQQQMADALRAQSAAHPAYSAPAAAAPEQAPAAAPSAPTPDIEGYLASRFGSLPYGAPQQGDISGRYHQALQSSPGMSLADAFASASGGAESDAMTRRLASISGTYAPGFENTALTSASYQPTVQALHDEMLGGAHTIVDRARTRGQLSNAGLNAANTSLSQADPGVTSRLNDIGNSVLSKYRGNVANEITNVMGDAKATPWYQDFSLTPGSQRIGAALDNATNSIGGDIRSAVGGSNFFDPSTLLGGAAAKQGPINDKPKMASAAPSGTDSEYKKRAQSNVGVF